MYGIAIQSSDMRKLSTYTATLALSGILIGYRFLDLSLDGGIPYTPISFDNPQNVVWALIVLILFFFAQYLYLWRYAEADGSKFELFTCLVVVAIGVGPYAYDALAYFGIDFRTILAATLIFISGIPIGIAAMFWLIAAFSIRSKDEMQERGLGRIPPSVTALLISSVILTIVTVVTVALIINYVSSFPRIIQSYWQYLFIAPALLINARNLLDLLLCVGPKQIRAQALKRLQIIRGPSDLHEMHYQHIGVVKAKPYSFSPLVAACKAGDTNECPSTNP